MPEVGPMRQVIPASEVVSQCRTGDVVLFRSRGIRGGIVRQATSSSYDHIGMVLKFKTKEVGVLEALGNTGVHVRLGTTCTRFWAAMLTILLHQ